MGEMEDEAISVWRPYWPTKSRKDFCGALSWWTLYVLDHTEAGWWYLDDAKTKVIAGLTIARYGLVEVDQMRAMDHTAYPHELGHVFQIEFAPGDHGDHPYWVERHMYNPQYFFWAHFDPTMQPLYEAVGVWPKESW